VPIADDSQSRRTFLASLGALSAAGLIAHDGAARSLTTASGRNAGPGLALGPNDFSFAPGLIYLQTGSLGPTPRPVIERAVNAWTEMELNPSFYGYGKHEQAMDGVRAKAGEFLGCKTDELVLTNCTTEGMNWVAQGLTLSAGDRVLTTDQEHPGGRVGWDYVVRRFGVVLDIVPIVPGESNAQTIIDGFAQRLTSRTRVMSFSHLLSSTGLRMPVAELSALARSRGCIAVVDGAQAAGGVVVNVKALGCHVYATSGHKWLLGPKGTGLLYLSEELGKTIDPISLESGRAAYSASSGVTSLPSVIGLGAAIEYISTIGVARVESYNLGLRNRLHTALQSVPKLRVVSPPAGPLASPLVSFMLPAELESRAFQARMREKHDIELKVVPKEWFNGIRVSTHLFNDERQVDALIGALKVELA